MPCKQTTNLEIMLHESNMNIKSLMYVTSHFGVVQASTEYEQDIKGVSTSNYH